MELGLPLVFYLLILITGCVSSRRHFNHNSALFVFGDSLFDPGNNNYINTTTRFQANFWPYGESYFNPPTGRFSNGRIIPDFIAEYAGLPLIPAYLDPSFGNNKFVYGANFASDGAGVLVETNAKFVINLKTQLEYFSDLETHFRKKLGDAKTEKLLFDAVYLFSCGGNDYFNILPHMRFEQYVEIVMGNLTDIFKGIHEKGGRKFGILNLPQSGCFPINRARQPGNTCNKELHILSAQHNQQLSKKLDELEKGLEGFKYVILDYNTAINNRMKNPTQYGVKEGESSKK